MTVADFAVQALVAYRLGQEFPDDPLVAEEDAASLRSPGARPILEPVLEAVHRVVPELDSNQVLKVIDRGGSLPGERFWALDPVDGTQGFLRGDQYVVALALIVRGRVEIGVLGCPGLSLTHDAGGSIVYAVRNRGTFAAALAGGESVRLQVSSCNEPRCARVLRSFESDHIDLKTFNMIMQTFGVTVPPVLMDSQAKHAEIAAGHADLLIRLPVRLDFRDKIWDQAAGTIIIEEAGGRVTDMRDANLDFGAGRLLASNEGVIASNGRVHVAVLDALRRVTGNS